MMLNDGDELVSPQRSESFLHKLCVHDLIEKARKNGIKHKLHEHPLTFEEEVRNGLEDDDEEVCCKGCGLEIEKSGFNCSMENCSFHLHEFCATLPEEMKEYPEHPQHHLILCTQSHDPNTHIRCDVCNGSHPSVMPFYYHCAVCKFNVDLRCACKYFLVCGKFHNHELMAQLHPTSIFCSFCGERHDELGMPYQCRRCPYRIHEQCYSMPNYIEHGSHAHLLQSFKATGVGHLPIVLCGVCGENLDPTFNFYGCRSCKYQIHIKCSTKKWDPMVEMPVEQDKGNDELIQFPLPSIQLVQNALAQFIQKVCDQWKDAEDKNGDILSHPSHDHPLILEFDSSKFTMFNASDKASEYDVCNACMLPLLHAPFYSCNQSCKFILHKWCARLPRELKQPAHADTRHTLILHEKLDECFGFFECKGCEELGNGFAYKCNECEGYYLDVRCATLPSFVNYETHDHPLFLKHRRSSGGCISCEKKIFHECNNKRCKNRSHPLFFGCDACHFFIDIECLILPREISHWYDEHGFKLTHLTPASGHDDGKQDELDQYHCEFCEKKLDVKNWVYHCFECDQSLGRDCARRLFGLYPRLIKFGGYYDSPHHSHPLTCIDVSVELSKCCTRCHKYCFSFGVGFQCLECKILFGLQCAHSNE